MTDTLNNNSIRKYKLLFAFSWILFYLIFPTWALPVSIAVRASVFLGLIVFFLISAYLMDHCFSAIPVNGPLIILPSDIAGDIKNNLCFFIVICVAVVLHIHPLFRPVLIIGDEALHLQSGLWLYEHIDPKWHKLFQITIWMLIGLFLLIRKSKKAGEIYRNVSIYISRSVNRTSFRFISILLMLLFLAAYFLLLRNIAYYPEFLRYPHIVKIFYHIAYSAFGITHVGPRMVQLLLCILSAVYLYRTILLFSNKESALIGATIYLFLPVVFVYASLAEISCGTLFFVNVISFHLLRYIKNEGNRDLLLASFFVGAGFMYRSEIFLMFFICTFYLIANRIVNRKSDIWNQLKVMSVSMVSIIPWMIIGKYYNWRNYNIIWSNFKPFDGKVFSFFMHIPMDISWVFFLLFLLSVVFIIRFKRNALSLYFGLFFLAYYFFLALDIANYSPRLAMTYYSAIAVYLALFLSSIIDWFRWKHFFKVGYLILSIYLITICTVPSVNAQFLSSLEFRKLIYFPSDDAMKWVKENVRKGEKILTLRMMSTDFYQIKYGIDKNRIVDLWYEVDNVSTPEKLLRFYRKHNMSYIMFPYNADYIKNSSPPDILSSLNIFEYLKNNPDNEFSEIARYNLDDNYIYIYKLRENSP